MTRRPIPLFLLPLLALGCASPGPPRPPSLQLPSQATALKAQRIGPTVLLDFTIPLPTTDGDSIRGLVTPLLCRKLAVGPCIPVPVPARTPGPQHVTDTLPPTLQAGPPALLEYRLDLANDHGRSSGQLVSVFTVAGAAPPPAGPLTITPRPTGALITWLPTTSSATMQVDRTIPNAPVKPKKTNTPAIGTASPSSTTLIPTVPTATDPGGLLDTTARPAQPYTYTAQRVQTIRLVNRTLEIRGLPSPPATFTYLDTFPPATPTGLVTIPGGGFGAPPSIDLSWEPVPSPDVAGYNIYRADPSAPNSLGAFRRLNPKPVPAPAYRDLTAQPNHPYLYRVTSIDAHNNESPPTPEVKETLTQ